MFEAITGTHKPDILDCISNLSSDEVFTSPEVVNQVLDLLPEDVWTNPDLKWLDPACKSGVFLREAAKRLLVGLQNAIADEDERRDHIFKNMLYGIAITELTGLISRRSLYYSKDASCEHSVVELDSADGNIHYSRGEHRYVGKKCIVCGTPKGHLDRGEHLENYAYQFIHKKDVFDMKFDVIIGNPPYMLEDGAGKAGASPIYQFFVQRAKKMEPKYISMIIPSRWFAGGKGLDAFRAEMLADDRISHIVDFHDASDCFPGVEIKGGVCYFLWNKNHHGECEVTPVVKGEKRAPMKRPLGENDVVIRFNESVSILKKVQRASEGTFSKYVSSQTPFGLHTTFKFDEKQASEEDIEIFGTKKQGWTARGNVKQNRQLIDKYKVLLSYAYNAGDGWPHQVINRPFVVSPPSCCTQTYVAIGPFDDAETAKNVEAYIKTKFFRFMVSLRKVAQHNPRDKFDYVPDLDMSIRWTDSSLYEKFELTKGEIAFVESMIREMP